MTFGQNPQGFGQPGFNTASGMRSHVTTEVFTITAASIGFNTASGMRSHVTKRLWSKQGLWITFQYRKRYEVTCDPMKVSPVRSLMGSFNTASGMRSHVTSGTSRTSTRKFLKFQYRKRYEVTCDVKFIDDAITDLRFQYRKRYEVTCDWVPMKRPWNQCISFQYRKRYEVTCDVHHKGGKDSF